MITGKDKLSDFPDKFNSLEMEVKSLTENTRGIKIATWVTAISTLVLAVAGIFALLK